MICYGDRTWCGSPNCKNDCGRQFTAQDEENAIKWWGGKDFPIAMANYCGEAQLLDSSSNKSED